MQTVSEAPCTIEGYEQSGYHRQGGWQPDSNFTVPEQLIKYSDNNVIERRQRVRTVAECRQESFPIGQPGHMNGKNFIEPEETMGRDIQAGCEVEGRESRGGKETPRAGILHRRRYLRQARILQGFLVCGGHR